LRFFIFSQALKRQEKKIAGNNERDEMYQKSPSRPEWSAAHQNRKAIPVKLFHRNATLRVNAEK